MKIGLRRTNATTHAIRLVNAANLSVVESAITGGSADLLTTNLTPGRWYEMTFDLSFQHNSESPSASTVTVANLQLRDRGTDGSLSGNILLQLASTTYNHPHGINLDNTHDAYAVVIANRDRGARILDNLRISAFGFPPTSPPSRAASSGCVSPSHKRSPTLFDVYPALSATAYIEFGVPAPPSAASLRGIIPPEEIWPVRQTSAWTTRHAFGSWKANEPNSWLYPEVAEHYFGPSDSLAFVR